jgi:hypothetical protein
MNALKALRDLQLGSPASLGDLTVISLLTDLSTRSSYLTLDEAIADHVAEITEVSEGGAVGQLKVKNGAKRPVLILDGEELVGAKQNRIVNLTILVAAASTLEIPVTCVEAGRWGYRSRTFSSAGRAHYASARAMKLGQVSRSMATDGARRADQHAVWAHIANKSERMHALSEMPLLQAVGDLLQGRSQHLHVVESKERLHFLRPLARLGDDILQDLASRQRKFGMLGDLRYQLQSLGIIGRLDYRLRRRIDVAFD